MSVYTFLDLLMENITVTIFDFSYEKDIFEGDSEEAAELFGDYELISWQYSDGKIILNIDTSGAKL